MEPKPFTDEQIMASNNQKQWLRLQRFVKNGICMLQM